MNLTKKQEKKLTKVFNDPKKLRKWIDDVFNDMVAECEKQNYKKLCEYIDIYSICVAYTLRYVCGFGKKRLPEIMDRIWNNVDAFREGYLDIQDCIDELYEYGIDFDNMIFVIAVFKNL